MKLGEKNVIGVFLLQSREVTPEAIKIKNGFVPNMSNAYDISGDRIRSDTYSTEK